MVRKKKPLLPLRLLKPLLPLRLPLLRLTLLLPPLLRLTPLPLRPLPLTLLLRLLRLLPPSNSLLAKLKKPAFGPAFFMPFFDGDQRRMKSARR